MKTIKTIFLATAFLFIINVNAQEGVATLGKKVTFGLKAGLNISDIDPADDKEFDNTKSKLGFHAGITLDYAFNPTWYLLTGLQYTTKGVKIDLGSRDMNVTAAYVQLPISGALKFQASEAIVVLVHVGPYFAYGLHGKSKHGNIEYDTFSKEVAKKFDCGILFGAGIEWQKLCFELSGESGMINIMQKGNSKAENRNFALSVGYKF